MSGWQYLVWVFEGLGLLVVCCIGLAFLGSLARRAWREVAAWVRAKREEGSTLGDIPNRKTRRAMRQAERIGKHIMRMVRKGQAGL